MIVFNTERPYTRNGQRIAADFFNDRHGEVFIVFSDVDRHIDGVISTSDTDCELTQAAVMAAYDASRYAPDGREHSAIIAKLRAAALKPPSADAGKAPAPAKSLGLF